MQFANRQVLTEATGATVCHGCKVPSLSVQSYPWVKARVLEVFPYNFLSFLSEALISQPLKTSESVNENPAQQPERSSDCAKNPL
jgi:hypothetical protein